MFNVYSEITLEKVRQAVMQVQDSDLAGFPADKPLQLDSICRISLIVELENLFEIEIPEDQVNPEMFETLASLAGVVEGRRA